jgi:hypothetical protein
MVAEPASLLFFLFFLVIFAVGAIAYALYPVSAINYARKVGTPEWLLPSPSSLRFRALASLVLAMFLMATIVYGLYGAP